MPAFAGMTSPSRGTDAPALHQSQHQRRSHRAGRAGGAQGGAAGDRDRPPDRPLRGARDVFAREGKNSDVVLLACFGDPGLFALREISPVPVVGMAEASCHLASTLGRKFSIVTGGHRWGRMLEELVGAIGLSANLAAVRTVAPSGGEIAAN